jgi:RNA polymerase sigma factor (sigma-70 family)
LTDRELLERFTRAKDETAFATLLRRHGPMVLRVSHRQVPQLADAEDVFQATFLLLVRKANGLRRQESVGNWLYGVAYRLALKARRTALRRRAYESRASIRPPVDPLAEITLREAQTLFDEALIQLPERCRGALVLCHFEGLTQDEAARQLGCSLSTLKRSLDSGRERLRKLLARRGLTLTSALLAAMLAPRMADGALGRELTNITVRAALACAGKNVIMGVVSARVVALVEGGLKTMFPGKQIATVLLLALGICGGAGAILCQSARVFDETQVQQPEPTAKRGEQPKTAEENFPRTDRHGDPLPEGAISRLGTVRFRHGGYVTWLTFTPDGKQIISHGYDAVRIWEAATGKEIARLAPEPHGWIGAAFLTGDGKTLVTLEQHDQLGNTIRLRNRADLKVVREFNVEWLQMPQLSPDGKLVAGLIENNSGVEIWDLAEGKRLRSWKAHEGYMWCHEFSADSKTLITGGADQAIRFWDVATGEKKREITGHPNVVSKVALSGDGSLLATIGMTEVKAGAGAWYPPDNFIRIWDAASAKELRQLRMPNRKGFGDHPEGFHFLTFAPDGVTLVTAGQDDLIRFWNPATGQEMRQLPLGSRGVAIITFSPDGKTLAVGTNAIRLIDVASGEDLVDLFGHRHSVFATAVGDSRTVITAGGEGDAVLWDIQTGRESGRLSGHGQPILNVRLVGDGQRLLTSSLDMEERLWDLGTGQELRRFEATWPGSSLLAISLDGQSLALRGKENTVVLTELNTGNEISKLGKHDESISGAAFTPDGRSLITWCNDHTAHVWDIKTARELRHFEFADVQPQPGAGGPIPPPVGPGGRRTGLGYAAAVSPDCRLIAYGSQAQYLGIHEILTGKTVRVIDKLEPDGAGTLAFSPDGRTLAWCTNPPSFPGHVEAAEAA